MDINVFIRHHEHKIIVDVLGLFLQFDDKGQLLILVGNISNK